MKKKRDNIVISLLITVIFMIVIVFVWNCYYAVNDDITIGQKLSGCYTGSPRPEANIIQYPLALIISVLFHIFPEVDVYGLFLFGSHFFCLFLIVNSVMDRLETARVWVLVLFCFVVAVVEMQNIIFFQFTTAATIYAVTSVFMLLTDMLSIRRLIISIVCLFFSFCIRKETFIMVLPFVILAWIVKLYREKDGIRHVFRIGAVYFILLVVLAAGIYTIHRLAGREQFCNEELTEFSKHRKNIRDYDGVPDYDTNLEFYQSIGVTKAEYNLIRYQMISMDFSTDIREIVKYIHQYNIRQKSYIELKYRLLFVKDKFLTVFNRVLIKPQIIIVVATFLLLSMYLILAKKWMWFLFLFLGWLGTGFEMFCLMYKGRLNERVVKSLVLLAAGWMFGIFVEALCHTTCNHLSKCSKIRYWVIYALLLLSYMGTFGFRMLPAIEEKQQEYERRYQQSMIVNEYCSQHSDNIYFFCYRFLSGDTNKLGNKYNGDFNNRIRIGLTLFTPVYYESLERAGITGNEEEAITTQENVFLMGENVEGQLPELDQYFKEKYGDAYSYEVVDVLENSVYVWKVHLAE